MTALVLAGAALRADARVRHLATEAELVVAADGGLRHAETLGVEPDVLVGDEDSVTRAALDAWPGLTRHRHPAAKDDLDLELALAAARDRGATRVRVVGAIGDRLDQTLAAVLIAARHTRDGLPVSLHDARQEAHAAVAGGKWNRDLPPGTTFSLLAVQGDATVDVRGARYPLEAAQLPFGVGLGVSNRAEGPVEVRVREGLVSIVVEWAPT